MTRILPNHGRPPGRATGLLLGLAAVLLAPGVTSAGTQQEPPEGLPAGPVLFAPWFQTEVLADDNIFRRSNTPLVGFPQPESDVATTVRGGVTAYVPIRMSNLEFGYEGSTFFYRDSNFAGTDQHTAFVLFDLNFSSEHTMRIEETYTDGFTELQRAGEDTGGTVGAEEIIRQGVPFSNNILAVEWLRQIPRRPSFRARIQRNDLRYRPEDVGGTLVTPWLDREGWQIEYEYLQPVYRRGGLTGRYIARREEQFEPGPDSNWLPKVPDQVPLRREEYTGLEVGYRGLIGRNQPLVVWLGYATLGFRDIQGSTETPSDYKGLIANVTWRLPVGGVSNMSATLSRRPLASIYNTYYIINEVRVRFDRRFREVSQWGLNLQASSNRYGDVISTTANNVITLTCTDRVRHDRGQQMEAFWEWFVQPRVAVRMSATHNRRNSNCDEVSYRSNALGMTFRFGWF